MPRSARRRYFAIVIVGAAHILILDMFIHVRGARRGSEEDTAVWSTLFFVPAEVVQRPPPTKIKPKRPSALQPAQVPLPVPETLSPLTTTPGATSSSPESAVDWVSALHSAAADAMTDRTGRGGATGEAPNEPHSLWAPPQHHAGEQYTLSTGELIVWVSDRCYLVSEPPALGMPNAFAHLALTHTQCTGSPGPRSDLFKDLPAHKNLHPNE
jgi:hypothetical protein